VRAGECSASEYPLQKKRHGLEFLRSIAHLRPRTNVIGAVMRVRSALAQATHAFFSQHGFLYVHTPIISTADCEGAGEMFQARFAWLLMLFAQLQSNRVHGRATGLLRIAHSILVLLRSTRQGILRTAGHETEHER
jgi:tRNA synthetases class II (D, K and N)